MLPVRAELITLARLTSIPAPLATCFTNNDDAGSAFIFQFVGKGDLNGDGNLTPTDVVFMLNCVYLASGYCGLELTDLTCNNQLTPADLVKELNAVFLLPPFNSRDCPL